MVSNNVFCYKIITVIAIELKFGINDLASMLELMSMESLKCFYYPITILLLLVYQAVKYALYKIMC